MPLLLDVAYLLLLVVISPYLFWRSWRTGRYRRGLTQKLLGTGAVSSHTVRSTLACLDACGGEFDQPLEEISDGAHASVFMPNALPRLVCFPVVPGVEQVDTAEIAKTFLPAFGVQRFVMLLFLSVGMPLAITSWMRILTGYIRIWRQRLFRHPSTRDRRVRSNA